MASYAQYNIDGEKLSPTEVDMHLGTLRSMSSNAQERREQILSTVKSEDDPHEFALEIVVSGFFDVADEIVREFRRRCEAGRS